MGKAARTKPGFLPTSAEIARVYRALNLAEMFKVPYDQEVQWGRFRKPSLYTDNTRGYATGNTRPGQQPEEF